uniref:Protein DETOXIFICATION n=1 Tax=Auxenochlorella protothecoides TaxID=3075 RepID=A0A1D1ZX61_AUXPR
MVQALQGHAGCPLQHHRHRICRGVFVASLRPPQCARIARSQPGWEVARAWPSDQRYPQALQNRRRGALQITHASNAPSFFSNPHDGEIMAIALPALLGVLLDPLMGLVDTAIVGSLGTTSLAAVGLSGMVFNLSLFIWNFLLFTTTPRIATAVGRDDREAVSRVAAQGLWMAVVLGVGMSLLLWTQGGAALRAMGAGPEVMAVGMPYFRARCLATPSVLMFYVLAGVFRGLKDTRTPLIAGLLSNIVHVALDFGLVYWAGWGVLGAGLATSLSHWVTVAVLGALVIRKGHLRPRDLLRPPDLAEVLPLLRAGVLLSTRMMLAMGTFVYATRAIAGFGAAAVAGHEILRTLWVTATQAFSSLDIATQTLVASYLGKGDRKTASDIVARVLRLAAGIGALLAVALLAGRQALPTVFTSDPAVQGLVTMVLPLVALGMPLDAVTAVCDGTLLGAQEISWLSKTMVVTSAGVALGLIAAQKYGWGILGVWAVLKGLTLGRLAGAAWRLASPASPLQSRPAPATAG